MEWIQTILRNLRTFIMLNCPCLQGQSIQRRDDKKTLSPVTIQRMRTNHAREPLPGIEPGTPSLPWKCSTAELKRRCAGSLKPRPRRLALERETRFELATLSLEG